MQRVLLLNLGVNYCIYKVCFNVCVWLKACAAVRVIVKSHSPHGEALLEWSWGRPKVVVQFAGKVVTLLHSAKLVWQTTVWSYSSRKYMLLKLIPTRGLRGAGAVHWAGHVWGTGRVLWKPRSWGCACTRNRLLLHCSNIMVHLTGHHSTCTGFSGTILLNA